MKTLSIIILTYNSEKDIYACLNSVYQHNDIGEALEVIVVDNQSNAFALMQQKIAHLYPQVIITQNTHNGGYGQGNNVGIRMAQAPIIAIMNPDVRITHPIFKEMLQSFNDESIVMCGGKQLTAEGGLNWSFAFDYNVWGPLRIALRNIYKRIDKYDYRYMHLSGAFFMVRKKEFEAIGLFDESIFMYGEECDIHLRFRKMYPSKKMLFMPHITYLHLSREREFSAKRYQNTLNADVYVCKKHGASVSSYFAGAKFAVIMCYLRAVLQKDDYVKQITPLQLSVLNNTIKNGNK